METAIQITTLIGTTAAIILGVIAICLTLYFYRRANEFDISMRDVLSEIQRSSRVTEATSRDVLHPVVETILGVVRSSTRSSIDSAGQTFMQKSAARLDRLLKAETDEDKKAARQSFIDEINSLLGTLRHEVGKVGVALEPQRVPAGRKPIREDISAMPGSPSYNWTPFVRRIRDMQLTHKFLSVKWLREKKFGQDPELQEALQIAIDRSLLLTSYRDNPANPAYPTLCCELNPDSPIVRDVLETIRENGAKSTENQRT